MHALMEDLPAAVEVLVTAVVMRVVLGQLPQATSTRRHARTANGTSPHCSECSECGEGGLEGTRGRGEGICIHGYTDAGVSISTEVAHCEPTTTSIIPASLSLWLLLSTIVSPARPCPVPSRIRTLTRFLRTTPSHAVPATRSRLMCLTRRPQRCRTERRPRNRREENR